MKARAAAALMAVLIGGTAHSASGPHKTPYWGSLSADKAKMRTGPGRTYPASWLYQRQGLPVRVIEVYPGWRKIQDQDGTGGWMIAGLISDKRTAMVKGGIAELRVAPSAGARVAWRAEPGVIGTVSRCASGWCKIDVHGRGGYVEQDRLWGVDPGESFD